MSKRKQCAAGTGMCDAAQLVLHSAFRNDVVSCK